MMGIRCFLGLVGVLIGAQSIARPLAEADTAKPQRGTYSCVLTVGIGNSLYRNYIGTPALWQQLDKRGRGQSVTLRAMWYPDHRLRTGLETGLTTFYTYSGTVNGQPASVKVSAIPVLLVFSMPLAWHNGRERRFLERFSLTGGTGAYLIRSQLDYNGLVNSQEWSIGWLAAASYAQPIGTRLRVAAEGRWLNASATKETDYSLQLQLLWRVFSW